MFCSILPFAVLTLSSWSAWCYLGPRVCILSDYVYWVLCQMNAKQALSQSRRDDLQGFSQCWCWCGSPRCSLRLRSACWAVSTVDWQECLAMQSVLVVVFPHASSDSKDFTFVLVKAHTCTLSSCTARLLRSFWSIAHHQQQRWDTWQTVLSANSLSVEFVCCGRSFIILCIGQTMLG